MRGHDRTCPCRRGKSTTALHLRRGVSPGDVLPAARLRLPQGGGLPPPPPHRGGISEWGRGCTPRICWKTSSFSPPWGSVYLSLQLTAACILDDGDEVLIPEPFYPNYDTFIGVTGGKMLCIFILAQTAYFLIVASPRPMSNAFSKIVVLPDRSREACHDFIPNTRNG